ncbi:MAG: hypothetical protein HY271_21020 [Deltaproteobacteria bacterium]|nr:hypothetical protein [Deltaproteobacteria bacterium]
MLRRLVLLALAALVAGCPSVQQQYVVRRANLSCDEANRYAFASMRSLGYSVGQFRLATVGAPGMIKATRPSERGGDDHVTVDIRCQPDGIEVFGAKDESLLKQDVTFSRGFFLAFTGLADHGPETAAWNEQQSGGTTSGGAKFKIQPQIGLETKLDFGEDLAAAGILAVKVTVQNGSDRTYKLDPAAIELRNAADYGVKPIGLGEAAAKLASASAADAAAGAPPTDPGRMADLLRGRALTGRTLRPGDQAEGFIYFPTGSYTRARATLVDTATDESEGFLVEF